MYVFNATEDQLFALCENAFKNSKPVGYGALQFKPGHQFERSWIVFIRDYLNLDYVMGRMVKITIKKIKHKSGYAYSINSRAKFDEKPDPEYQSWCHKFPTYDDLFKASGITEYLSIEDR